MVSGGLLLAISPLTCEAVSKVIFFFYREEAEAQKKYILIVSSPRLCGYFYNCNF